MHRIPRDKHLALISKSIVNVRYLACARAGIDIKNCTITQKSDFIRTYLYDWSILQVVFVKIETPEASKISKCQGKLSIFCPRRTWKMK